MIKRTIASEECRRQRRKDSADTKTCEVWTGNNDERIRQTLRLHPMTFGGNVSISRVLCMIMKCANEMSDC